MMKIEEGGECNKDKGETEVSVVEELCISVNALNGVSNYQSMRIAFIHKKKPLHILMHSGCTKFYG